MRLICDWPDSAAAVSGAQGHPPPSTVIPGRAECASPEHGISVRKLGQTITEPLLETNRLIAKLDGIAEPFPHGAGSSLIDDFIDLRQHRRRDREPKGLHRSHVEDRLKLVGCSIGRSAGLAPLMIFQHADER